MDVFIVPEVVKSIFYSSGKSRKEEKSEIIPMVWFQARSIAYALTSTVGIFASFSL